MVNSNQVADILENIKDAVRQPNGTGDAKALHNACLLLGTTIISIMSISESLKRIADHMDAKAERERTSAGLPPSSD